VIRNLRIICLTLCSVFAVVASASAGTPVHLRINTSHGLSNALGAVTDAGLSVIDDVIISPSSEFNGRPFLPPDAFMRDALSVQASIMSSSFSNWDYLYDTAHYLKLTKQNLVHVFAYEPRKPQPLHAPPPAAFTTVNVAGGKTGGGIEFGIPKGYMNGRGQDTSASGVTAQLAGLMASIKYRHPAWNWFDVKSALRVTASNYPTGYSPDKSGYGSIDFRAANALTDAAQFPLFPPAAVMRTTKNNTVIFAINSYKQTRRSADALFRFRMRPFPTLKELTLTELNAMGGQLLFSGDHSESSNAYAVQIPNNEMSHFVWLGRDAKGIYSRIEQYSILGPVLFSPANK